MDYWWAFLIAAAVCFVLDRSLGLAHLFTGFAVLLAAFGLAGAAGINLADYDIVVELLAVAVFTLIFVRLFFVLQAQRAPGGPSAGMPGAGAGDRNAETAFKGLQLAGHLLPLFAFHFVTGGLIIVATAMLAGWIPPTASMMVLSSIGCPYAANYIADRRGVEGFAKYVWMAGGLLFGFVFGLLVTVGAVTLHG